jgi:hypothetical protein
MNDNMNAAVSGDHRRRRPDVQAAAVAQTRDGTLGKGGGQS